MIKVKECISGELLSTARETLLKDIIVFFREHRIHTLPVTDNGRLVGQITLDDITSVFQPQSPEINQLLETLPLIDEVPSAELDIDYITPEIGVLVVADEIMSKNYFVISPEDSLMKAYSIMKKNSVRHVMVADAEGRLSGVLEYFDIIYTILRQKGVVH